VVTFCGRAADFNQDSKLDYAITNGGSANVSVLLGNGDGTFKPTRNYATAFGPQCMEVAHLRGPRAASDLVIANTSSTANSGRGTVSVLLGNGDGTFRPQVQYPVGIIGFSVGIGDLNRDGNEDVVVANGGSGTVSVLYGNGDGTLRPAVDFPV
jgi:hypothetical protein